MALVSKRLMINKNWLVVESDVPFYIAFNATAPNALKDGEIKADDFVKSRGGSRYFSCTDLLSTSMKVCGYNVWLVWDSDNVIENMKPPSYYTCYTKPDTLQGLDGQIVMIGGATAPIETNILPINTISNFSISSFSDENNYEFDYEKELYLKRGSVLQFCTGMSDFNKSTLIADEDTICKLSQFGSSRFICFSGKFYLNLLSSELVSNALMYDVNSNLYDEGSGVLPKGLYTGFLKLSITGEVLNYNRILGVYK